MMTAPNIADPLRISRDNTFWPRLDFDRRSSGCFPMEPGT